MAIDLAFAPTLVAHLGDLRWVRGHISMFCIGTVLLVSANLLIGGSRLWSLTAIGIWIMLLVVHVIVIAIARLSHVLLTEDDEGSEVLPIKDALIVTPQRDPASTWVQTSSPPMGNPNPAPTTPQETVSWTVATNAAQAKRPSAGDSSP